MNHKDKNIQQELKTESPFLKDFLSQRKGGFQVPKNYFEQLNQQMDEKIAENKSKTSAKIVSMHKKTRFSSWKMAGMAASVAIVLGAALWFTNPFSKVSESPSLAKLSQSEVLEYLDKHIDKFQLEDLEQTGIITTEEMNYHSITDLSEEEKDIFLSLTINELESY